MAGRQRVAAPVSDEHGSNGSRISAENGHGERQPLLAPASNGAWSAASKPPNGGSEAWLFVLAGFFVFVNSWGISSTFGVFLEHYRSQLLRGTSPSTLSWVGSVQSTFVTIMGLVTGPLTDRGYLRPVMVFGHFMVVFGMLMLSISTEYWQVMLAQGFCVGIGAGAINIPAFARISSQFTTRRPIALGCASTGASVGGIVFPLIFRQLVPQVGFSWAVRAIALVNLIISIPTLIIYCRKPGIRSPTSKMVVDPRGFTEPIFGTFVTALFFQFLAYYIPLFYLSTYAAVKLHTGADFAFELLAISNAASFFGRTVPYLLSSRITPIQILFFWEAVGIVLLFSWMAVDSVSGIVVWTVAWGFLSGVLVTASAASTAHPTLSPSLDVIGARLGMSWSTAAIGVLIGAPIAGALADVANADFVRAQVFAGVVMAVAMVLMTIPLVAAHRYSKQKAEAEQD
ncbi:major facilitator superfamily domain-containing protein [Pseudomassariella vexata]|uniref:Major facilitator superfamily domain-containing protein n=1 Tax=Pseudomassariella vexata TaxID=1141098 RepID=A0A1Y2DVI2_9PEZI|nr:major facilitator superfamily domain-containing protein [Pseudomassariella vexata]ORY63300.1 major facilitator superfamily domain-containing protein [Pseudomassariella vexata]